MKEYMDLHVKKVIPYLIENENYKRLQIYYTISKENTNYNQDYKVALIYEKKLNDANKILGKI